MIWIMLIVIVAFVFLLVQVDKRIKINHTSKLIIKKILLGIPMAVASFFGYYIIIGIIGLPILMYMYGAESGAWAIALIAGFTIGPILSLITTWLLLRKN